MTEDNVERLSAEATITETVDNRPRGEQEPKPASTIAGPGEYAIQGPPSAKVVVDTPESAAERGRQLDEALRKQREADEARRKSNDERIKRITDEMRRKP